MEIRQRIIQENGFLKDLRRQTKQQKAELVKHLGNPPTTNNVPVDFWDQVLGERQDKLWVWLTTLFALSASLHGQSAMRSLERAQDFGEERSREVSEGFIEKSKETLEAENKSQIGRKDNAKHTAEDWADKVFNNDRDERIAVTETTQAQSRGGEDSVKFSGLDQEEDKWITESDQKVCPICRPLHNARRSVWETRFPYGPPAHFRCRCFILYAGYPTEGSPNRFTVSPFSEITKLESKQKHTVDAPIRIATPDELEKFLLFLTKNAVRTSKIIQNGRLINAEPSETEIDSKILVATQPILRLDRVKQFRENPSTAPEGGKLPQVVKRRGRFYILDGHHRAVANALDARPMMVDLIRM